MITSGNIAWLIVTLNVCTVFYFHLVPRELAEIKKPLKERKEIP